jgi:hypothetical protein
MDLEKHTKPATLPAYQEGTKGHEVDGSIPTKYRGSAGRHQENTVPASPLMLNCATDQRDMATLGKKQVLRVKQAETSIEMIFILIMRVEKFQVRDHARIRKHCHC